MLKKIHKILLVIVIILSLGYILFWSQLTSKVQDSVTKSLKETSKVLRFKYDEVSVRGFHRNLTIIVKNLQISFAGPIDSMPQVNLGDTEINCDLFSNSCKVNIQNKIIFGKFSRNLEFKTPPQIIFTFRENIPLNELRSKDYKLLEIFDGISYSDEGYVIKDLNNSIEIYSAEKNDLQVKLAQKDQETTLDLKGLSEGEEVGEKKYGLGKTSSQIDYNIVMSPNKFAGTLHNFELKTSSFSIFSKGTFAEEKFAKKYDLDFTLTGLSGFLNYVNKTMSKDASFMKPLLLKISGNENNQNIEEINFKVTNDPLTGEPVIGSLKLSSLMSFYLELISKESKPHAP